MMREALSNIAYVISISMPNRLKDDDLLSISILSALPTTTCPQILAEIWLFERFWPLTVAMACLCPFEQGLVRGIIRSICPISRTEKAKLWLGQT